jgi:phage terminase small subunit
MARTSRRDAQPDQGSGLTDAQERFCLEYVVDLNATRAYKAAYPRSSAAAAESSGSRLLGNAKVLGRIKLLKQAQAKRCEISADVVLQHLLALSTSDIDDVEIGENRRLVVRDGANPLARKAVAQVKMTRRLIPTGKDSAPIEEVTAEVKLRDKNQPLRMLAQHLGILTERPKATEGTGVLMVPGPATPEEWTRMVEAQRAELAKPYVPPKPA